MRQRGQLSQVGETAEQGEEEGDPSNNDMPELATGIWCLVNNSTSDEDPAAFEAHLYRCTAYSSTGPALHLSHVL